MLSPGSEQPNLRWYSPNINRADAEALLTEGSPENGFFLVRDSTSAPGDFGLSVVVDGEVLHYQIRQHGQDAFYSVDEGPLIHGLDKLVEHYRSAEAGLAVRLTGHHPGTVPPPHSMVHGSSTLLHRATEAGDLKIVWELLKAGYQQVNYKDGQGQTALHLAARLRRTEILPLLLEHGCSPHVRDSNGLLPLHYSARVDHAQGVRHLVDGGANLQARCSALNRVPLHEAAESGALDALKTLLALNAPCRPRDKDNRTPADLARAAAHTDCVEVLDRYKPPLPRRMRSDWLHGVMSRKEAEKRLRAGGFNAGDFLVRTSKRNDKTVLSMVADDKVLHLVVYDHQETLPDGELARTYVYLDDGPYLDSLEHLVEHYSTLEDGLKCCLLHPVPPSDEAKHRAIADSRREVLGPPPPLPLPRLLLSPGTISAANLEFGAVIGNGEFGKVYQGRWRDPRGRQVDVAIKTCQEVGPATDADREQLLREAACMKDLRHPCIVRFLGVMQQAEPFMLVQELVALGSLLDYLTDQPESVSLDNDFKVWAGQVASGMEYLEKQRIVHRDLAARNILVASASQVKISDFGFSRLLAGDRDYYVASEGGKWPIKWYAPEAINFGQFHAASDVWSFGVLLWEMFSYGEQPYGNMTGAQAFLDVVEKGQRLQKPEYCPGGIYEVMLKCWAYDPKERPSFCILHRFFNSDNEYRNLSELTSPQMEEAAEENGLPPEESPASEVAAAAETEAAAAEDFWVDSPLNPPLPRSPPPSLSPRSPAAIPLTSPPAGRVPPAVPPRPGASPQPQPKTAAPAQPEASTSPLPPTPRRLKSSPQPPVSASSPSPPSRTPPPATRSQPASTAMSPAASESTDLYDVLSAARSVPALPRGERPALPPKPAFPVRRRPPPLDDMLYDSPRSHNLQRLRAESAPPAVLAAALSAVSISVSEPRRQLQPSWSTDEAVELGRPVEPPEEGGEETVPPPALSPYSLLGGEETVAPPALSPYSLLGACDGSEETYDVPISPVLSPTISVLSQDSDTYDVLRPRRPAATDSRS